VHRIGRTGRAGMRGRAFTLAAPSDAKYLAAIERLIGRAIPRFEVPEMESATLDEDTGRGRRRRAPARKAAAPKHEPGRSARTEARKDETPPSHKDETPTESPRRPPARQYGEPKSGEAATPETKAAEPRKPARQRERPRAHERDHEPAPVGMGEHVPAFMLRSARRA
jgi:superfamily II DNA/RNA helicase